MARRSPGRCHKVGPVVIVETHQGVFTEPGGSGKSSSGPVARGGRGGGCDGSLQGGGGMVLGRAPRPAQNSICNEAAHWLKRKSHLSGTGAVQGGRGGGGGGGGGGGDAPQHRDTPQPATLHSARREGGNLNQTP